MLDIKFYEVFGDEKYHLKKLLPKKFKTSFTSKTIQESGDRLSNARIVCTRTQSRIHPQWLNKTQGVLSRSQGFDSIQHISRKVKCGYLGSYCSHAVAEHAVVTMQVLLRKLKRQMEHFKSFHREELTGIETYKHNVLVVGVGSIGQEIIKQVKRLGMKVKGFDIDRRLKSVQYTSLKAGLKWADVIFCALPLNDKTRGLLGLRAFRLTGKGKYLVNISRGEITPTDDLKKMLDRKILAGLSMDVFEGEGELAVYLRNPKNKKADKNIRTILQLNNRDNVIFTPHNAFNTQEALEEKCRLTVSEIVKFSKTGRFKWRV